MKSRISNNLDGAADMGTYFEMPLRKFISQMPQYAGMIYNSQIDIEDTNYIVRFRFKKNGVIDLEIGYPEDVEWRIGQPDRSKKLSYPASYEDMEKLLDEELAQGGSFIVLPMRAFIEKHPEAKEALKKFNSDSNAVCFFRSNNNVMRMIIGEIGNSDDDWKRMIQSFDW